MWSHAHNWLIQSADVFSASVIWDFSVYQRLNVSVSSFKAAVFSMFEWTVGKTHRDDVQSHQLHLHQQCSSEKLQILWILYQLFCKSSYRCGVCEFCTTLQFCLEFGNGSIAPSCRSCSASCSAPNNTLSLPLAAKLKKQMIFSGVDGERAEWRVNIVLTFIKWPESALQMNANVAVWLLHV